MVMKLSKNFTLEEMVATSHPRLQDTPTLEVVQNLQRLCVLVLQPLRDTIGAPVYINSGYRSKRLNARVGAYRIPDTCWDGLPTSIATTSTMQK